MIGDNKMLTAYADNKITTNNKNNNVSNKNIERIDLIVKAQSGDKEAFDLSVVTNQGLIKRCVSKALLKYGDVVDREDLIQEGNLGLIKAINTFDVSKGTMFSTHAWNWIMHFITRYIENNSRTIRVPVHVNTKFSNISKYITSYVAKYGVYPSKDVIVKQCDVLEFDVDTYLRYGVKPISLDQAARAMSNENPYKYQNTAYTIDTDSLMSVCNDLTSPSPEQECVNNDIKEKINKSIDKLSDTEKAIVLMRFGLEPYDRVYTLSEISQIVNTTPTTIRNKLKKVFMLLSSKNELKELA